jgi:hypothetical protein
MTRNVLESPKAFIYLLAIPKLRGQPVQKSHVFDTGPVVVAKRSDQLLAKTRVSGMYGAL